MVRIMILIVEDVVVVENDDFYIGFLFDLVVGVGGIFG